VSRGTKTSNTGGGEDAQFGANDKVVDVGLFLRCKVLMDLKKKKKKKKFEKKEQKIVVKARVISSPIHLPGVCVCLIFF
jgi:hypothetical protein